MKIHVCVDFYKECYFGEPYPHQKIIEKALQLGIDIVVPNHVPEEERDEWEEENNCLNNYKLAFMELFLESMLSGSYDKSDI